MEENVFPLPAVAGILESEFVEARLHTDLPSSEAIRQENLLFQAELQGSVATPYYLLIDPREPIETARATEAGL